MASDPAARPAPPPARRGAPARSWARRYLPPQHGAWAMLLVPMAAALIQVGASWIHGPLLAAWLSGYGLSYFAFQAVRTRRLAPVRRPLALYAAVAAPAGALVVAARPAVLAFAPIYALLLAVNAVAAARRSERSLVNDLASVAQGCLMVPVAAVAAGAPVAAAWTGPAGGGVLLPLGAVTLYFAGTVFLVKTLIRNRGEPGYFAASVVYHALAAAAAAALAWPLGLWFGWLLARAVLLPARRPRPWQVGVLEIAHSAALLALLALLRP